MERLLEEYDANPAQKMYGFSPLSIISMHENGAWAIQRFGSTDRVNESGTGE